MHEVMIEAKGLGKHYGAVQALQDANFVVRKGEVLGFLGPNGAGKTTTMKILTCYIAPSVGTAKVAGSDIFEDPIGVRRSIGYLPESTPLYVEMQVREYVEFMAQMRGLRGSDLRRHVDKAVEETSIGDVQHKEIRQLSKGYRQRVGLAQALVHEPPILILDEPMSGLDPNQAVEIRDLIRAIGKERTVILSTHNLPEVQVTCQRVLIVAKGRIVADDTPEQLQNRAGKPRFVVSIAPAGTSPADAAATAALDAKVQETFGRIGAVEKVRLREATSSERIYEVTPTQHQDLRAELSHAAAAANLSVLELRKESENLEQVFRQLTVGDEDHVHAARSSSATPAS